MDKLNMQKEPVRVNEVKKSLVWIISMLISGGYISATDAQELNIWVPVLSFVVALGINWAIAELKQRANVTPWNAENEKVLYPEDVTPI